MTGSRLHVFVPRSRACKIKHLRKRFDFDRMQRVSNVGRAGGPVEQGGALRRQCRHMHSTSAQPTEPSSDDLAAALARIPLTLSMRVGIQAFDGRELTLEAPLAPNVNDKGCAFGGSLVSLMTLAGWGLVLLRLGEAGRDCDIYVQDSNTRYLEPLWGDLRAHARIAGDDGEWDTFAASLATRGRGRIRIACRVATQSGSDACTLDARFVAIARARADTR